MVRKYFLLLTTLISFVSISSFKIVAQQTFTVSNQEDFNNAISAVTNGAGDTIEWVDGTYTDIVMNISRGSGTIIKAQTSGGVIFNGESRAIINADDITFTGFQYVGGNIFTSLDDTRSDQFVINVRNDNVVLSHINIQDYSSLRYLNLRDESENATVIFCNFENRINDVDQNIVQVEAGFESDGTFTQGNHKIQYCSFKNFQAPEGVDIGDGGVEPIRIGSKADQSNISNTIIEYCYFTECNGDGEMVSYKARRNTIRFNTFENNPNSEVVLRHGADGIVYGNFFLNGMGGVRIREGQNHVVFNNYFEGITERALYLQNRDGDASSVLIDNVIFAHNTFVNSEEIRLTDFDELLPTNIVFANNIFTDPVDNLFRDATGNEEWIGNIAFGDLGNTNVNESDFSRVDPELTLNTEGFYQLTSDSPAIDNSSDSNPSLFPFATFSNLEFDDELLLDITSGTPLVLTEAEVLPTVTGAIVTRPTAIADKDIGAQEYSSSATVQPFVTDDNTGPFYLMPIDPILSSPEFIENLGSDLVFYPNPVDRDITFAFNFNVNTSINIEVYDITGKKITTLVDENFNRGSNTSTQNINISTGIYLLIINVTDSSGNVTTKTEKLLKL